MFGLGDLASDIKDILNSAQFRVNNTIANKADAGLDMVKQALGRLIVLVAKHLRLILLLLGGLFVAALFFNYLQFRVIRDMRRLLADIALGNRPQLHAGGHHLQQKQPQAGAAAPTKLQAFFA